MEIFNIEATEFTPFVLLNHENHMIELRGESRPENVNLFFDPIFSWIEEYSKYLFYLQDISSSNIVISVKFNLEYFNSSTAKKILDILEKLAHLQKTMPEISLVISWYYDIEDEDMLDTGKEYEILSGHKFVFCPNN